MKKKIKNLSDTNLLLTITIVVFLHQLLEKNWENLVRN